ncbi:MAG TPA: bifunctional diguanylate cyclase/phosphodiesterase [Rhizomicrobium sp.]|nr:bifunctional diguanylate cyclase/phosphodiesterase [Rhizomicrobium sp.]
MVVVLNAVLQKRGEVARLDQLDGDLRLRLAAQAAAAVAFDWDVAAGTIRWDGATEILPLHLDATNAASFLESIALEGRTSLLNILEMRDISSTQFLTDVEVASAMGAVTFTLVGTRIAGEGGSTARLVGLMRDTTERVREVRRLSYLATRDELTGHLNRNALREELAQTIESAKDEGRNCAFLVASIDRLAMINDGFGFDAGEEVIMGVGERLARTLRGSDIIGRIAGNKFGVILKNCREREIAVVAARLRSSVRANGIDTRSGMVAATCSVGAVWLPQAASTSQEAMLRAEQALDRARANGRDGFAAYQPSPSRETARLRMMQISDEVMGALRENRLKLAYQPIVQARSRQVSHYECLLRMVKPDGSVLTAGHFVPAAEQMGIVHLVDRFALEATVGQLKAHRNITLAVNVSGTAATDPVWLQSFVDYVRAEKYVAPRLIVELTETAALHHFEENAHFISQLREVGVRVAIDDFGAGYTSFRNLQMLHVDTVKIDGSYVSDLSQSPENQVFVRTLVSLAKSFDIKTVAEWVGSDDDAALLQSFGVDYFQGFHFGEPVIDPKWDR